MRLVADVNLDASAQDVDALLTVVPVGGAAGVVVDRHDRADDLQRTLQVGRQQLVEDPLLRKDELLALVAADDRAGGPHGEWTSA